LHVVELEIGNGPVLAKPEAGKSGDAVCLEPATNLDGIAGERNRVMLGNRGEVGWRRRSPLEPGGVASSVDVRAVAEDRSRRRREPTGQSPVGCRHFERELVRRCVGGVTPGGGGEQRG